MYRDNTRPSAVSPAMATPMWSSTLKIFFWCDESSELALLTHASTTWVFDLSPIAAEPCFTASIAYSTWNSRPAGDHVVTSVSYWFLNIFFTNIWSRFTELGIRFNNFDVSLCSSLTLFQQQRREKKDDFDLLFFFFKTREERVNWVNRTGLESLGLGPY